MGWEWGPVHGRRETPYVWTDRQTYTSENITLADSKKYGARIKQYCVFTNWLFSIWKLSRTHTCSSIGWRRYWWHFRWHHQIGRRGTTPQGWRHKPIFISYWTRWKLLLQKPNTQILKTWNDWLISKEGPYWLCDRIYEYGTVLFFLWSVLLALWTMSYIHIETMRHKNRSSLGTYKL